MRLSERLARLCVFLGARLPLRVSYAVAQAVAGAMYALSPPLRADSESTAAYVLGQPRGKPEVKEAARRSMRNYARDVVDLLRYTGRPVSSRARVSFDRLDRLDEALAEGKGVILLGLHLGAWDVGAAYLAQCGYPMSAVVLSPRANDGLDRFMHTLRAGAGVEVISTRDGVFGAGEALRRNTVLCVLIDGPTEGKSVPVTFLNRPLHFSAGPAALALRSRAAVVPACTIRQPDHTFQGFIGERVLPAGGGSFHGSIESFTQRMMDSLEGFVREHPDQWALRRGMGPERI